MARGLANTPFAQRQQRRSAKRNRVLAAKRQNAARAWSMMRAPNLTLQYIARSTGLSLDDLARLRLVPCAERAHTIFDSSWQGKGRSR